MNKGCYGTGLDNVLSTKVVQSVIDNHIRKDILYFNKNLASIIGGLRKLKLHDSDREKLICKLEKYLIQSDLLCYVCEDYKSAIIDSWCNIKKELNTNKDECVVVNIEEFIGYLYFISINRNYDKYSIISLDGLQDTFESSFVDCFEVMTFRLATMCGQIFSDKDKNIAKINDKYFLVRVSNCKQQFFKNADILAYNILPNIIQDDDNGKYYLSNNYMKKLDMMYKSVEV